MKQMLRNKIVRFKKIYKIYFDHFLIGIIVFLMNMKNAIKVASAFVKKLTEGSKTWRLSK